MRNLFRAFGLSAVLVTTVLSTSATADTLGTCRTRCTKSGSLPTSVTWTTTAQDCCSGTTNPCPAGYTPIPTSWNGMRCAL